MPQFTCYRIRPSVAGSAVTQLADCVDPDEQSTQRFAFDAPSFEAELHVVTPPAARPRWGNFLDQGFNLGRAIPQTRSVSALLVVALKDTRQLFAFAFGPAGRHLLRDDVIERSYGRRTALNLIYPLGQASPNEATRLRSVDTKRVAHNVARNRRQLSRDEDFLAFDIDQERDILRSVTGTPADRQAWGSSITGMDAIMFSADVNFRDLADLCTRLEAEARKADCDTQFPWVSRLRSVQQEDELAAAHQKIIDVLDAGDTDGLLQLSPPEILDWSRIRSFSLPGDRTVYRPALELAHYLLSTQETNHTVDRLKARRITALDADQNPVSTWPVWRCLSGSVSLDETTYVIDDGEVYEVAASFLAEINQDVATIPLSDLVLPDAAHGLDEQTYNATTASRHDSNMILLDRELVSVHGSGSRIEVCDLLSPSGHLVHVKRDFHSRTLSHLFNQGLVSAEALLQPSHREAVLNKLPDTAEQAHRDIFGSNFDARQCEIVFGIVGNWRGRTLAEALPFFSRVTLRYSVTALRRLGFHVSYAPIQRQLPPPGKNSTGAISGRR